MNKEDLWNHPLGEPPIALLDGSFGLLTVYPTKDEKSVLCGVQVPGEDEHRWYHHDNIIDVGGGALVAVGRPIGGR